MEDNGLSSIVRSHNIFATKRKKLVEEKMNLPTHMIEWHNGVAKKSYNGGFI